MKIKLAEQRNWKVGLISSLFILLFVYAIYNLQQTNIFEVSAAKLKFQTVEQGNLDIYANVYGEFISARERLITAPAQGIVAEILVRPGTQVTANTVILQLSNPALTLEVNEAKGLLAQQQAQHAAYKFEQKNDQLTYRGRIADIEADIEQAQLELTVNENLMNLGSGAKIELQRATLRLKQARKRLDFEQQKYNQFIEMQHHQLTQKSIVIKQQAAKVQLIAQQLADMNVKAGITGTLQSLNIELGESTHLGQSLARVGSDNELIARLNIPQHLVDQININTPVIIDTQKGLINAHVNRIESMVNNGSVLVEAILDQALTANARPALTISAKIFIKHQQAATYVTQVAGLRPQSLQRVFVLPDKHLINKDLSDQKLAQQKPVHFGVLSENKLLVLDGLTVGERIISSDTNNYKQYQQLAIIR